MNDFVEGNFEDKYNAKNPISRFLMQRFLQHFRALLETTRETYKVNTICEVGCGEGELLKIIREYFPSAKIFACDLSPKEISKAKANCKGLGINFKVQNAQELSYSDKQFDLVIACEVLEHIPEPKKALEELQRVGSIGILSVPVEPLWRILNILRLKYVSELGNTPGHLNHWSPISFRAFLSNFNLRPNIPFYPLPWQMYLLTFDPSSSQEAQGLLSPYLRRQRYKAVSSLVHLNDTVLDLGCGSGALQQFLPNSARYYGLDTKQHWSGDQRNLFVSRVEDDLPKEIKGISFTTVTALAILEHVKEPAKLFSTASTVLPIGGRLIVTTPHPLGRNIHDWGANIGVFSGDASEEHEQFLDKRELYSLAIQSGFELTNYNRFLFGLNQVAVFKKLA